ncbi:DNA-directed RNA polymerase [Aspergillus clavatus NRRL 1]|uniref:DNA-directed RNA polymerase n=1 Tax=Aspergillus clavatus (strain ATCC 1007 / CBS 513.65 / DSM 816 / NCTC 3887 / NRRL 1 / QM 1276 / 107) TaxID=344612 RepID=A1C7P8_ASPCL|nr:mitochondrial DNA-directed RNA polymerase, putative [Aspergillus clavatus NRRL 1]EAW14419.1 mitochondrial DNA-directed RNA polymerase, putative [Aspergillus clavatus NRRL 1]
MLSRVARQKNAILLLRQSHGHRVLPSLTALRFHAHSSRSVSLANSSANSSQERFRRPSFQANRTLATAADQSAIEQGSYVSFDDTSYAPEHYYDPSQQWSHLFPTLPSQELDPSSLIIMGDSLQTKPKVLRKVRGIGGDEDEMLANLDISLKVGRFDRAATLVNRLGQHYPIGSPEYLALHNRYLEKMVSHMIVTRQQSMVLPMQRWFELDMPNGGVKPDATTYAIMIRMALRMLHGSKRDRAVRRYWQFAKKDNVEEEVLAVPVLSELELGELSEICSSDLQRVAIGSMGSETALDSTVSPQADVMADVRPVEQKGLGLSSLKQSLSLFLNESSSAIPTDPEQKAVYDELRQRQLESDSIRSAMDRWRQEFDDRQKMGLDVTAGGKKLGSVMNQWHSSLVARIKEELDLVAEAEANPIRTRDQKGRCEYGVYLRSLDTDTLAALTILAVMSTFSRGGMEKGLKVSAVVSTIGKDLQDELIAEAALKKQAGADARRAKALKEMLAQRRQKDGRTRWQAMVYKMQQEDSTIVWPPRVIAKVGAVLMSLLFEVGKAPVTMEDPENKKKMVTMQPAFQHAYQITWGRRTGYLHLHPAIVKIIAKEPTADLLGRHLPMVCKPRPWKGSKDGGFLLYQSDLVRTTPGESLQPTYIKTALENNGLEEIRRGLDNLGSTGWVVNRDVLNVMLEAWNSGEATANIAPLEPDLPLPPKPAPEAGYEAEKEWDVLVRDIENRRSGLHSMRCFQNFQMELARAYRNSTFYLPHNMDFRGRAYPLPPYLNQMGADNSRGLLLFSEAKPLGASGLKWLKIQIANLSGFDKASLSEREQFAMDHLDDVLDSADKGLHGKRWWLKAEDPWQCLAACCELRNALRHPDPTQYPSRLPIHQDGSCNGLQHYAALGGDSIGAQQVNLEPSDRPSDVYTGVAEFVKKAVARDAAQGNSTAKILEGKITRKIVKQTVMTNVYGVTFMGAMRQVRKQLIDHYPELSYEDKKQGALYIARKIFEALGSMFNGAHEIQHWLGDCASRITTSLAPEQIEQIAKDALTPSKETTTTKVKDPSEKFRSTVIWTTPLGLPVVQPYRVRKARRIQTTLQDLSIVDTNSEDVVSKRKQLQAFPPNFIHSLDATHMILSANACSRAGLTFSAVHDSFWTHACDVDLMNDILREAFVRMHSDDIIKRLASEFQVRYGQNLFLAKVDVGTKIGRAIRSLRRTEKKRAGKLQELLEEYKRQQLLRSDDPELQAQGRAMVTACSVFEKLGGTDEDLAIASTLGEAAVGHIPEDLAAAERKMPGLGIDTSDPAIESLFSDFQDLEPKTGETDKAPAAELDDEAMDAQDGAAKKKPARNYVWLWLPLRFREVPTKGAWDLTRIRDSKYFFS